MIGAAQVRVKGVSVKAFLADWRNTALTATFAVCIFLLIAFINVLGKSPVGHVFSVGNRSFSDGEIVGQLKAKVGNQLVMKLLMSEVYEQYARQKGVTVTENELRQMITYYTLQAEFSGKSYMEVLETMGITSAEEAAQEFRLRIIRLKLLVPDADVKKTFVKEQAIIARPYPEGLRFPARYKIRQLIFSKPDRADKAYKLLQEPTGLKAALALTTDAETATKTFTYIPGIGRDIPQLAKAIKSLKSGQCSKPISFPGDTNLRVIIQIVKAVPEEAPTVANRDALLRQYLFNNEKKYQLASAQVEAEALRNADIQFQRPDDYPLASQAVEKMLKENISVPTPTTPTPKLPTSSAPKIPAPAPSTGH